MADLGASLRKIPLNNPNCSGIFSASTVEGKSIQRPAAHFLGLSLMLSGLVLSAPVFAGASTKADCLALSRSNAGKALIALPVRIPVPRAASAFNGTLHRAGRRNSASRICNPGKVILFATLPSSWLNASAVSGWVFARHTYQFQWIGKQYRNCLQHLFFRTNQDSGRIFLIDSNQSRHRAARCHSIGRRQVVSR